MMQELTEEIENTARAAVNEIHTAMPGIIASVDAEKCTVTVKPQGKYPISEDIELDYPMLAEVPLVFPFCQQAGAGMAFPVKKGDSCLIIVSEVELDEWRDGAEAEGSLRFDLANAVAIPGLLHCDSGILRKAVLKNAVVIGAPGAELSVSDGRIDAEVGGVTFSVSESGIYAGSDLKVKGNISYTGSLTNG